MVDFSLRNAANLEEGLGAKAYFPKVKEVLMARVSPTLLLSSGECNIRVDLLLLYPVLLVISLVAVVSAVRWRRGQLPRRG